MGIDAPEMGRRSGASILSRSSFLAEKSAILACQPIPRGLSYKPELATGWCPKPRLASPTPERPVQFLPVGYSPHIVP